MNLINSGIVVRGDTASIQFAVNGDATTLTCRMDRRRIHRCKSDTISVLLKCGDFVYHQLSERALMATCYFPLHGLLLVLLPCHVFSHHCAPCDDCAVSIVN